MKNPERPKYMEAFLIHGSDKTPRWDYKHHLMPPITSSVTYRLETVERGAKGFSEYATSDRSSKEPIYIYERLDDPTTGMLEDRLATAEGGESAVVFSTGMAAIAAALGAVLQEGDHLLSHDSIYGCTYSLFTKWFPRGGVDVDFVNMVKEKSWPEKIHDKTRVIYFETPINPTLELLDIQGVREVVDGINRGRSEEEKIIMIVDNTFASPFCQRPLTLGADLVIESLTKHIGGFNTGMGGVVVASREYHNSLMMYRKDYGNILNSATAWQILVYGLPTLASRLRQQTATAGKLAEYLSERSDIKAVHYPGLPSFPQYELAKRQMVAYDGTFAPGAVFYFVIDGSLSKAQKRGVKLLNWLAQNSSCYTLAVSLGCVKTLIEHPSSMSHAAIPVEEQVEAGIEPGGVRVSVGLEEAGMLIEDLEKAFNHI